MRILTITNAIPYPLISGFRIRNYHLLRKAASQHEMSLVAFLETEDDVEGAHHLRQFCAHVETASFEQCSRFARVPGMLGYALAGIPPDLRILHSDVLVDRIRKLTSTVDYDVVQINSRMARYLDVMPHSMRRKSIMMFDNFTYQQGIRITRIERRWDRKLRRLIDTLAMARWEPRFAERFDRCTTVSELDRRQLLETNRRLRVDVIPNGVDTQRYKPLPAEGDSPVLLFIGHMGYPPCADAVQHFCRDILPLIRRKLPSTELWIVGRDPRPEVLQLHGDGVHVTGRVDDVVPFYSRSSVSVVPLRAGGGTRLKILESMALGRPVVSTSIGCEGLEVQDGEHLLIADRPEDFAEKTIRLLTDKGAYRSIAAKGRQLVEARYAWDKIAESMLRIYDELVQQ